MEQKLSDTLVKAIDRSNPMMQNLQLASRFNKLVEEGGGSGGGEDKLLCYLYSSTNTCVVYTDKPARKIFASEAGSFQKSILPVDDGEHLFITNTNLAIMTGESSHIVNLVYRDGSPNKSLKGKFVEVTE